MRVGVIGAGYVGLVTAVGIAAAGHDVAVAEADPDRLKALQRGEIPFFEPGLSEWLQSVRERLMFVASAKDLGRRDAVIVAVGTPSGPLGQTDLSQVRRAVSDLAQVAARGTVIVMKSTVPPGTGRELLRNYLNPARRGLRYVSNPEFLREGKAVEDWLHPARIVIGTDDEEAARLVRGLYRDLRAPVLITDITSAEMIKYAANALLATKISFINEIANLCEAVGANIDDVAKGVGMDPRLGPHFLQAGIGYGGSCFPKDTRALDFTAAVSGYSLELLRAVIEVNRRQRIRVVHRLATELAGLAGKRVAVLGLAFKPDTDDARESPGLEIAAMLAGQGALVRVYDPLARLPGRAFGEICPGVVRVTSLLEATEEAGAVVVATEWQEFREANWAAIRRVMVPPYVVYDGRNCLNPELMARVGFRYMGVGRRPVACHAPPATAEQASKPGFSP